MSAGGVAFASPNTPPRMRESFNFWLEETKEGHVMLEDLIQKHKQATTQHTRAEIERDLWNNYADSTIRASFDRQTWLKKILGAVPYETHLRQTLLNAGADISPIWARTERDPSTNDPMPLRTAWGRLKAAEIYAQKDKIPLAKGVEIALAEYDTWPQWRTVVGQMYRRQPAAHKRTTKPRQRRSTANAESDRKFWFDLKNKFGEWITNRLDGVDHLTANDLQRDFFIRLQTLCDEFSGRLNRTRGRARKDNAQDVGTIKLARVKAACITLAIDPPSRNHPVNLSKARQNRNRLVVQYHPDKHIGADEKTLGEMKALCDEVVEAHAILEEYNEQVASNTAH